MYNLLHKIKIFFLTNDKIHVLNEKLNLCLRQADICSSNVHFYINCIMFYTSVSVTCSQEEEHGFFYSYVASLVFELDVIS